MAPPQEAYFYDSQWTERLEARVVNELLQQKKAGVWVVGFEDNNTAISNVRTIVNEEFSKEYGIEWYTAHVDMLATRYETLKLLWDYTPTEFHWSCKNNKFYAPEDTWIRFEEMNPLTTVYRDNGEPHYLALTNLFETGETPIVPDDDLNPFQASESDTD